jgi:hypothetical protein
MYIILFSINSVLLQMKGMKTIVIYETYDPATHIQNKTSQNKQKERKKKKK